MRYTNEQEARARVMGQKILEHQDKRYSGYMLEPLEHLRGSDYRVKVSLFDSKPDKRSDSQHVVMLFRAECVYVCDCQAQDYDRPCKHVGIALEDHDLQVALAEETRAEDAAWLERGFRVEGRYTSEGGYQEYLVPAEEPALVAEQLSSCEHCGDVVDERALRQATDDDGQSISVCPKCHARDDQGPFAGKLVEERGERGEILYRPERPFSMWRSETNTR